MGILQVPEPWAAPIGGVSLWALALGLVWLADKIANQFELDIPDGQYGFYASFAVALIIVVLAFAEAYNIPILDRNGMLWQIIVAIILALGYDFTSEARATRRGG